MERGHNGLALGVSFPLVFLAGYLGVAAGVKRCHDLNKTGYTYLLSAVPLLGLLFILYLLFAKGDSSSNRFGPPSGKLLNAPSGVAPTLPTEQPLGRSHLSEIHDVKNVPSRTGATEQDALTLIPAFDEDEAYTRIALEIETKSTDKGLWLKAMVQADSGDGRQQAIAYTGLRMHQLRQAFLALPAEKISTGDDAVLDQLPKAVSHQPENRETGKTPDDHRNNNRNTSFDWTLGAVVIGVIGLVSLAFMAVDFASSQPAGIKPLASSQPEAPLERTASLVIVPEESKSSNDSAEKSAIPENQFSSLLGFPPSNNLGEKWYECSKDLEEAFRPHCFVGGGTPNTEDYCSKVYLPKISKLSSNKTQYGTNYILLLTRIQSPVTFAYRAVYSCEISRAGEVISLVKSE